MKKIKISDLKELKYNPRTITKDKMERLKYSIKKFNMDKEGYRLVTTITVNKNGNRIIGGHQRVKALKELGQEWIDVEDITWVDIEPNSLEEKSLNVILNSENFAGEWNEKKLNLLLKDIGDIDILSKIKVDDIEVSNEKIELEPIKEKEKKVEKIEKAEKTEIIIEESEESGVSGVVNDLMPDQQLFPISFAVSSEQRKTLMEAITKAKIEFKYNDNTEAIVRICENYIND